MTGARNKLRQPEKFQAFWVDIKCTKDTKMFSSNSTKLDQAWSSEPMCCSVCSRPMCCKMCSVSVMEQCVVLASCDGVGVVLVPCVVLLLCDGAVRSVSLV